MLRKLLSSLKRQPTSQPSTAEQTEELRAMASEAMAKGDMHNAASALRKLLEQAPHNLEAMNDLGCCLADLGQEAEAAKWFAQAFALDDRFVPGILNFGKLHNDKKLSDEALPYIEQAKIAAPDFPQNHAIYSGLCFNLGKVEAACWHHLKAWLVDFDHLRCANCYLFFSAYNAHCGEQLLASEHLFWGETLKPIPATPPAMPGFAKPPTDLPPNRRIRIGYWSPDFRGHSVTFFFRPLLENHDADRVEVYAYYDFPQEDTQTQLIKSVVGERFFDVSQMASDDLVALMQSHQLDILVELAGHSSNNRINYLSQRLARLQVTGLGYPPTTGLKTVDYKVLDRHVATKDAAQYYTERPLVLPASFWCYDPMKEIDPPGPSPVLENGYVTFGVPGNISKITTAVMAAWRRILSGVPDSRLQIRSINFEDPAAERTLRQKLTEAGLPLDRIDFVGPARNEGFFKAFDELDIVLDTQPFNGGTTTAFALYMGVPVVSLVGRSLTGRMGLSMLTNMGVPHLAVDQWDTYVEAAIKLAGDHAFLRMFRATARQRFKSTALGNGALFARDFEAACMQALHDLEQEGSRYQHQVPPLPANELARRAYVTLSTGQHDAAQRIADHCLAHYPNCGAAHIIKSHAHVREKDFASAAHYLRDHLSQANGADRAAMLINLIRLDIYLAEFDEATRHFNDLTAIASLDPLDCAHRDLFAAILETTRTSAGTYAPPREPAPEAYRCNVLVVSDDVEHFQKLQTHIHALVANHSPLELHIERTTEADKLQAYDRALRNSGMDFSVLLQQNVIPQHPAFLHRLARALKTADIVAGMGCRRWIRLDWRLDDLEQKAGGALWNSSEADGFVEISLWGHDRTMLVENMAILDGKLLAVRNDCPNLASFDKRLVGADTLAEETWTYECHLLGARLAVHHGLGMHVGSTEPITDYNMSDARWTVADQYGFQAFADEFDDRILVSGPAFGLGVALATLDQLAETL